MGFIAAKCTQCGANIEVDKTQTAGICPYCKTPYVTEKAIQNYVLNISSLSGLNIQNATININLPHCAPEDLNEAIPPMKSDIVTITYPKYVKTQILGLKWFVYQIKENCKTELAQSTLGNSVTIKVINAMDIEVSGGSAFGKCRATVHGGEHYVVRLNPLGAIKLVQI